MMAPMIRFDNKDLKGQGMFQACAGIQRVTIANVKDGKFYETRNKEKDLENLGCNNWVEKEERKPANQKV